MYIKKIFSFLMKLILSVFFMLIITLTILSCVMTVYFVDMMKTTELITIEDKPFRTHSSIYAINNLTGTYEPIYKRLCDNNDIKLSIDLEELPAHVADAFICTEDERFYEHQGVDYKRTAAAFINELINMYGSTQGGSTITQQLIKNITDDNETTWERKIREIFRAIRLEQSYTKDEILSAYLNTIYFGQDVDGCNMYGIETAAIGYFGKSASELTIAEAASLAAVPQNPYYENPISNYEENQERKNYCLLKMFELGKISPDQYEEAIHEKVLVANMPEFKEKYPEYKTLTHDEFVNPSVNSWAVDTAINEFCETLVKEYNITEEKAFEEFCKGGYELYITINSDIQGELEKNYSDLTFFPKDTDENGETIQSAFVVLDYHGRILGIVGGIGEKESSLCWNHATMSRRQPGSTIKPLSVYGYGIENGLITWSSVFTDAPLDAGVITSEKWPENYNNFWSYKSNTVSYFLKRSLNTLPAQLCVNFGTDNIFNFAVNNMHLDLDPQYDNDYAPLSVGATNRGPTLLNTVNAYMPYGNGGKYYEAHILEQVIDITKNKIIIDNSSPDYEQAVRADTAYIMNKMLQNVINPNQPDNESGTGVTAFLPNKTVAGKTGTTQNWRDIAFIGLTEDFVSGIWIGYETGENPYAIKNTKAATIWKNVFGNFANNYASEASYPECANVKDYHYCTQTGLLAGADCPRSKESGYYRKDYNEYCNVH